MNPILLDLGFIKIHWYSVILLVAFLIGCYIAMHEAIKYKISKSYMINLFFYVIIFALIGARLYYVIFNFDLYKNDLLSIFKVWEGGLAIHGGIIAAIIVIIIYTKKYKISTLRMMDILVVSLILGQAIGRWGNFFNSEAYGTETTLEYLQNIHMPQFIIDGMHIDGTYYTPTFFYESILCLIGFILLVLYRNRKYTKLGTTTAFYLIYYGAIRFFIEGSRLDSLMLGNFKVAQIVSIIMVAIGIIMFIKCRHVSVFENNYNDSENASDPLF